MRFTLNEDFFKEEEINGFLVTEAMKRYWGATLRCLEAFSDICERHDLKWWVDWGSLLGAWRHKGFIPWDDDLDLGMLRKDYLQFAEYAKTELPPGFLVDLHEVPRHKYSGFAVVTNHEGTLFSEDVLQNFCDCPFPAGFDLYIYDFVPDDEQEKQKWRMRGMVYLLPMELIRNEGVTSQRAKDALKEAGYAGNYTEADRGKLLWELSEKVDRVARTYTEPTEAIDRYTFLVRDNNVPWFKTRYVKEMREVPFESASVPIPVGTDELLPIYYGPDYLKPKIGAQGHNYPLFRRDIMEMIRFLENGGIRLSDLPPQLAYIRREADLREIPYQK